MPLPENNPPANASVRVPLVVILGPTAVGKTELSLQLAERLDGEIVSADSRLFYRGMDIGTAKPSPAEQVRVPHHLIDVANPDQPWSLALFQEQAHRAIAEIHARNRLPFLVGGTGQYIRSVIEGWQPPQIEPNPPLRQVLEKWAEEIGIHGLHTRLATLDPQAAERIDPRNLRRTVRALEVILSSGQRFSGQRLSSPSPYRLLLIGLERPRPELYARIDERVDAMLQAGLVEEVRGLLAQGYSPALPTMSAIGYREVIAYLQGACTLEQAVQEMKRSTRAFVRRQANWFKANDPHIHWFQMGQDTVAQVESAISAWLSAS